MNALHYLFGQPTYNYFLFFVITLNSIIMILKSWKEIDIRYRYSFDMLESFFGSVYTTECVLKIYVYRRHYFDDSWNVLDLLVVLNSTTEYIVFLLQLRLDETSSAVFNIHQVIRSLRAIRIFRVIRYTQNIHVMLSTCLQSLRELGTIVTLMSLILVMFAVIGHGLFSHQDSKNFGSFLTSCFTLLKILTLDDWFDIFTEMSDKLGHFNTVLMIYLVFYIVLEYYTFLSLFIAVLEENFQLTLERKRLDERNDKETSASFGSGSDTESSGSSEEDEAIPNRSFSKRTIIRQERRATNDDGCGFNEFMKEKVPRLKESAKVFFEILPSLEERYQTFRDHSICHDRIVSQIINDLDDIPSVLLGD